MTSIPVNMVPQWLWTISTKMARRRNGSRLDRHWLARVHLEKKPCSYCRREAVQRVWYPKAQEGETGSHIDHQEQQAEEEAHQGQIIEVGKRRVRQVWQGQPLG